MVFSVGISIESVTRAIEAFCNGTLFIHSISYINNCLKAYLEDLLGDSNGYTLYVYMRR
jgi:hypothetical protein